MDWADEKAGDITSPYGFDSADSRKHLTRDIASALRDAVARKAHIWVYRSDGTVLVCARHDGTRYVACSKDHAEQDGGA